MAALTVSGVVWFMLRMVVAVSAAFAESDSGDCDLNSDCIEGANRVVEFVDILLILVTAVVLSVCLNIFEINKIIATYHTLFYVDL